MNEVTICTFHWGDWCEPFGQEYIEKLYIGITRHTTVPFKFICFTDKQGRNGFSGIEYRKLITPSLSGKLAKITAFDPNHEFSGQVFVFDLDTVVVGSIDPLLAYRGDFCARAWFKGVSRGHWVLDGDLISFRAGVWTEQIWNPFISNPEAVENITGGRERYWYRAVFGDDSARVDMWQKLFPEALVSYKNHCRNGLPEGARLVSFHGDPRPHTFKDGWVQEKWSY